MHIFLGCLFTLLFGGFIIAFVLFRNFCLMLFGKAPKSPFSFKFERDSTSSDSRHYSDTTRGQSSRQGTYRTGNAAHEGPQNRRAKGEGKIFEDNEGEYIDFEEV